MKLKDLEERAEDDGWGKEDGCDDGFSCGVDSATHRESDGNSSSSEKHESQKGCGPQHLVSIHGQNGNNDYQYQKHVLLNNEQLEFSNLEIINTENQNDSANADVTSSLSSSTDSNAVVHNLLYTNDNGFSIQETTSPELVDSALIDRKTITKASTYKTKSALKKKITFASPSLEKLAFLVITFVLTLGGIVLNALNIRKLVDFALTFRGTLTTAPTFKVMFKGSLSLGRLTASARFSLEDLLNPTRFEAKANIIINKTATVLPETYNMVSTTFSSEEDDLLQFSIRNIMKMLPAQGIWASKFCSDQESYYKTLGKQLKHRCVILYPVWGGKCCEWAHGSLKYVYHNIQAVYYKALTSMARVPLKGLGIVIITSRKVTTSIPIIWRKATFGPAARKDLVTIVVRCFAKMGSVSHSNIALAANSFTIKVAHPSPKFRINFGGIKPRQSSTSHSRRGNSPNHGGTADSGEGTDYPGTAGHSDSGTGGCSSNGAGYSDRRADPRDTNKAGGESNAGSRDNLDRNPDGNLAPEGTSNSMDRPYHHGWNVSSHLQRILHHEYTDIPLNTDNPLGCNDPSAVSYSKDILDPGGATDHYGADNPEGPMHSGDGGLDSNRADYSHRTTGYSCIPDLESTTDCSVTPASLQYKPEQRLIEAHSQKLDKEKAVTKEFTLPCYVGLPSPVMNYSAVNCVSSLGDYAHSKREGIEKYSLEPRSLFNPDQDQLYVITILYEPHYELNKALPDQTQIATHDYTLRSNSANCLHESILSNSASSDTSESSAYAPVGEKHIDRAKATVDHFQFLAVPSFTRSSAHIFLNNDADDLSLTTGLQQQDTSLFMIPAVEATSAGQYTTSVQNTPLPTIENNALLVPNTLLVPNSLEPYATPTSAEVTESDSESYMKQTGGLLDCTGQRNYYDLLWKINTLCMECPVKDNLEAMSSLGNENKP